MNIALVGFMGTGKTTVGMDLADHLGWDFVDTDQLIQNKLGMAIPEVFNRLGEDYFRQVEKGIIEEVSGWSNQVISTGGGAIVDGDNTANLLKSSLVICLECQPQMILARLSQDNNRPLLAGKLNIDHIVKLLDQRAPYYKRAHLAIDTSCLTITEIRSIIIKELSKRGINYGENKPGSC